VFESEAAASTAVLLNNALVDGRNIVVETVGEGGGAEAAMHESQSSLHTTTSKSVVGELLSEAKVIAGQVSTATKDFNSKYDVTGKMKAAYATAATTTTQTFKRLDEQYDIKGNTTKAVDATKAGLSNAYRRMSGLWQQPSASSTTSLARNAGSPSPNSGQSSAQ